MYYRPEQWDPLDDAAIEWCENHGLGGVLRYVSERACDAWKLFYMNGLDELDDDELDDTDAGRDYYEMVHMVLKEAYGAYNAILIAAHDAGREDIWDMVYKWGHYGVFY